MAEAATPAIVEHAEPATTATVARDRAPAVWLLVALAVLDVVITATQHWSDVPWTLIGAAPFVFAAALLHAAPSDRRYLRGAELIAVSAALALIAHLLADPILNGIPLQANIAHWLREAGWLVLVLGIVLVGLATGGLRSRSAWTLFWLGTLVGLLGIAYITLHPEAEMDPMGLLISVAAQAVPMAWGYLAGAALAADRRWLSIGAGLLVVGLLLGIWAAWFPPAGVRPDDIHFGVGLIAVLGWVALVFGALQLPSAAAQESHSRDG